MSEVVAIALAFGLGLVAVRLLRLAAADVLAAPVLARENYRGRVLPTAAGLLVVLAVVLVEAGRSAFGALGVGEEPGDNPARALVLFACLGFGFLGLVDDLLGTPHDRGFRGHIRALRRGRITTGALKLLGGAGIALVLAAWPGFVTGKRVIADAVLIALAANLANLLDRAPGRVVKVGLAAWVPIAIGAGTAGAGYLVGVAVAPVMGAFAGLLRDDLRERLMLGDAGANVLGAVLGVAVVFSLDRGVRNGVLVALVLLNLAAEVVSFSRVIDRVPPLRALDRLGRAAPDRRDGSDPG